MMGHYGKIRCRASLLETGVSRLAATTYNENQE